MLIDELKEAAVSHFGEGTEAGEPASLQGGASRELYDVTVTDPDGEEHRLVIRRDPEGVEDADGRTREWFATRAAFSYGVAVPEPLFRLSDGAIAMRYVEGESRPKRILAEDRFEAARAGLVKELAQQAAKIHSIPVGDSGLPKPEFPPAEQAIIGLEDELDRLGEPHPALELGIRWLWNNAPATQPAVVVHGDLRMGNLLVAESGLTAILDWELAHLGDAAEDLAWLCLRSWRFGHDHNPVAGVGGRDELLAAYAEAGGREISREELRFWEVYGNARWGVICLVQAEAHLSGNLRSLERAMIGRRTCEAEWDLLSMIRVEDPA